MQEIIWKVRYFEIDYQKALKKLILLFYNSIQDWGGEVRGQKVPPTYQFFPCNFYMHRNQPQKLSDF